MKILAFSKRNLKEILRDPLTFVFSIGLPLVLLVLMSAIQKNIPIPMFEIQTLAPGIVIFGLSFITLNLGLLLAKDRSSSLLMRLYASPLKSIEFLIGYILPQLPIAIMQIIVCFLVSLCFGLQISVNLLLSIVISLPAALLFIALGLLIGTLVNEKAVGGLSSIIVNVSAWLSGIWFSVELPGEGFATFCKCLPFVHCVDLAKNFLVGNFDNCLVPILIVLGYTILIFGIAILVFQKKMQSDKR